MPIPISAEEVAIKHRIDAWVYLASLLWIPPDHGSLGFDENLTIKWKRVPRYRRAMATCAIALEPNLSERRQEDATVPVFTPRRHTSAPESRLIGSMKDGSGRHY